MRQAPIPELDRYRMTHPTLGNSPMGTLYGWFVIPRPSGVLRVMSSGAGDEWEHVSVSLEDRCPTWEEMCFVKDLFWRDTETVLQFHPKKSAYVNAHTFCLHLWRRRGQDHVLPPRETLA